MNMLSGQVVAHAGGFALQHGDTLLALPDNLAIHVGQDIVFGIRPEHLRTDPLGALSAHVEVVEPMGNATHLTCRLGDTEIRLIEAADIDTQPGAAIQLSFDVTKAHVFDQKSQARVIAAAAR